MRAIDADKIIEYLDYVKGHADKYAFVGVEDILKIIENQPEVKAIVIPDNATNWDVVKEIFTNIKFNDEWNGVIYGYEKGDSQKKLNLGFNMNWLNEKYGKNK